MLLIAQPPLLANNLLAARMYNSLPTRCIFERFTLLISQLSIVYKRDREESGGYHIPCAYIWDQREKRNVRSDIYEPRDKE